MTTGRKHTIVLALFAILTLTAGLGLTAETSPQNSGWAADGLLMAQSVAYHGNVKSGKFHRPGCRYYNCKNCTAVFRSKREAMSAGYIPCKVCRP